jgi:hypothetical protein
MSKAPLKTTIQLQPKTRAALAVWKIQHGIGTYDDAIRALLKEHEEKESHDERPAGASTD